LLPYYTSHLSVKQKYNYRVYRLLILFIGVFNLSYGQTFERLNTQNLRGGYLGFSSFVDYNNDGYLDIFVTGLDFDNDFNNAVFYESNGDLSFTESAITTIPRVIYGDHSWADFDNNGTLDLLYTGTLGGSSENGISKVYRNVDKGCEFLELPVALPGISRGASNWVDIDNDGLLDIFLAGFDVNDEIIITAFKNDGNDGFIAQSITTIDDLPGGRGNFTNNVARWSDLDGDGLQDLVIGLSTSQNFTFEVYKNLGEFQFAKQNIGLPKLSYVAMEIGDVNNDQRPDIVFTGSPNLENSSGDGTGDFYVFSNNGNMNFTNSFILADEGVFYNDIALGDIDNDGFLDAVNYGTGPWGTHPEITKIYRNNGDGSFSNFSHALPQCRFGGVKFGDFDNDTDLDILYYGRIEDPFDNEITYVYKNTLNTVALPTEILAKENCFCDNTLNFTLNSDSDAIQWNFGDATTGVLNTSTDKKASHSFSNEGSYTISATFTKGSVTNTITKVVSVNGLPDISEPTDLVSCSNEANNPYDFNALKDIEILNGASLDDFEIYYYTTLENAQENRYRLSMPHTITNSNETIYARVQSTTNIKCFVVTEFQVTFEDPPIANPAQSLLVCDDDFDGFALFNLTPLESIVIGNQVNSTMEYLDNEGKIIPSGSLSAYQNSTTAVETITLRVTNTQTNCSAETTVNLIVHSRPVVNTLDELIGCDNDGDGISEYFDTSMVEANVVDNLSDMDITYFDSNGNQIVEFPNPYTNTIPFQETIVVRVTNVNTMCFTETNLDLRTSNRPQINDVGNFFECGDDEGFAFFDTSKIVTQLIGTQTGLKVSFYDANENRLNDFVSNTFRNQTPFLQQILVRVENELNASCYTESSFDLIVNTLPKLNLQESYFLCDLEPSIQLEVNMDFDSFSWTFEDGTQISTTAEATIALEGNYTLTVNKNIDGINCQKSFPFTLVRSDLPQIEKVEFQDLSPQNYIEIIATGNGDFEYSIDGITYFDDNIFKNVLGGVYTVYVRDKRGCGEDRAEVILVDYPRFFTPNGDNINDHWQIFGGTNYPNSEIFIYDQYGKMITQFSSSDTGWDGTYNQNQMPSSDYWFKADLGNGRIFKGHFALKR